MNNTISAPLTTLSLATDVPDKDRDFLAAFYRFTTTATWSLSYDSGIYTLHHATDKRSLCLDFNAGNYLHRRKHHAKEPLLKAVRIKQKLPKTLIDATPGVLQDSLMLASRGIDVIATERHPLLYIMVKSALSNVGLPIRYDFADAKTILPNYSADVIYLDPMYPPKKKNAQVKKAMQILHDIVGQDDDADCLLHTARRQTARVVVKRPGYAPPLADIPPDFVSQTGATRFDIYLPDASANIGFHFVHSPT